MKNKRKAGSLFGLLSRNYLLFTMTLLAIAGGLYLAWNSYLDRLYQPADWAELLGDPYLQSGEYARLDRYAGKNGGAFAVLDANGALLYSSSDGFSPSFTPGELECIPEYQDGGYVDSFSYTDKDGSRLYLLTKYAYSEESGSYKELHTMVLDSDYRVVSGGFGDGRSSYTPREYACLTGKISQEYELRRYSFTGAGGSGRTVVMEDTYPDSERYYQGYQASWRIWLAFIPLYLIAAGLFIWWLNRTIRLPLERLNQAVVAQADGRPIEVGDCGGTREIRQIGESFDQLSARLAESEQERRRLDEERQKLLANISHDLKTPITVIAGYADAIRDGKVPPAEQERYLRAIQNKTETLTALINAFHEYSKVEHPDFTAAPVRTDLCEYLREYLAKKYDEIDLAGFTLDVCIPETPIYCMLDELQFQRALDNLLSNSIRHNRLGTAMFFSVSEEAASAVIRVGDNGSGIPADRAASIFEPFVVGSDARSGGGSGLGLAITRRIVEKQGGSIALEREPRFGWSTEFVIRLPLGEA